MNITKSLAYTRQSFTALKDDYLDYHHARGSARDDAAARLEQSRLNALAGVAQLASFDYSNQQDSSRIGAELAMSGQRLMELHGVDMNAWFVPINVADANAMTAIDLILNGE